MVFAFGLLQVAPSSAHLSLKRGVYECWLYGGQYSNRDLKILAGGDYVWMWSDGTDKRRGTYVHDGEKIRFTSGFLKRRNFLGKHDRYTDSFGTVTHVINLYQGGYRIDDQKYNCGN